jgi:hypothetical protein
MAGYIGTKAVNLSTTAANVGGDADIGGDLTVDTSTLHVDSANNRVGVGTSLPSVELHVSSTFPQIRLEDSDSAGYYSNIEQGNSAFTFDVDSGNVGSGSFRVKMGGSEAMRISGGNLLVGTTTASSKLTVEQGFGAAATFNRTNTDGAIAYFAKDGSTVGSIGNGSSTSIYIAGNTQANSNLAFGGTSLIYPTIDNVSDLGASSRRFDDIYATNGTIQTSDRNEKQDIAELSDAEQRVAVAAKGLLRKFRWKDAVAEKGDEARTHFGIIAQDLQAAFAAEGLDAGDYAMFISTTWWEHDVEVPAVEAVAEVLDEEGNVVSEAVEAADAYTRTDTYDTQEEAPEGATERTRLGVRYSELLAFIIGAL